jgi:hypothetical protein
MKNRDRLLAPLSLRGSFLAFVALLLMLVSWGSLPARDGNSRRPARIPGLRGAAAIVRDAGPVLPPRPSAGFGRIPLQFIPNEGQAAGLVDFYVQGRADLPPRPRSRSAVGAEARFCGFGPWSRACRIGTLGGRRFLLQRQTR